MTNFVKNSASCLIHPLDCYGNGLFSFYPVEGNTQIPVPTPPPPIDPISWDKKILSLFENMDGSQAMQMVYENKVVISSAVTLAVVIGTIWLFRKKTAANRTDHEKKEAPATPSAADIKKAPLIPPTPYAVAKSPKEMFIKFAECLQETLKTPDQKGAFSGMLATFHLVNGNSEEAKKIIKSSMNHDGKPEKMDDEINDRLVKLLAIQLNPSSSNVDPTKAAPLTVSTKSRTVGTPMINSSVDLNTVFGFFAESLSKQLGLKTVTQQNAPQFGYFKLLVAVFHMSKNQYELAKENVDSAKHYVSFYTADIKNNLSALETRCADGLHEQKKKNGAKTRLDFTSHGTTSSDDEEETTGKFATAPKPPRPPLQSDQSDRRFSSAPPPPPRPALSTDGPPPPPPPAQSSDTAGKPKPGGGATSFVPKTKDLRSMAKEMEKKRAANNSLAKLDQKTGLRNEDSESDEETEESEKEGTLESALKKAPIPLPRQPSSQPKENTSESDGETEPTTEKPGPDGIFVLVETTEEKVELLDLPKEEKKVDAKGEPESAAKALFARRAVISPDSPAPGAKKRPKGSASAVAANKD